MNNFPLQNFFRLKELFQEKKWYKNHDEMEIFRRFGNLLSNLTDAEQELLLDLSERYLWVSHSAYLGLLHELYVQLNEEDLSNIKNLIFFPIIKPNDEQKTKSGNVILYQYQSVVHNLPKPLTDIKFAIVEQFSKIVTNEFTLTEDQLLILTDDFLGSGSTILATLSELDKNSSISYNRIRVVAITVMQQALDVLHAKGIIVYYKYLEKKGISDYYGADVEEKKAVMKKIERMTVVSPSFRMGYKKSEALVTMARTPNNTFSIFWADHIKDGRTFSAPFKR